MHSHEKGGQAQGEGMNEQKLRESISSLIEGHIDNFPEGGFQSALPDVTHISILKGPKSKETGKASYLYTVVYYRPEGEKERSITFTLTSDGRLMGEVPSEWPFDKLDLYKETESIVQQVSPAFFESVGDQVLPPDDFVVEEGSGEVSTPRDEYIDSRRIEFMRKQEGVLFGISGMNSGFRGYYGFAFEDFLIFENNKYGNAVYAFKLNESFKRDEDAAPGPALTPEERGRYIEQHWMPVANLTKKGLKTAFPANTLKVVHPGLGDESWEEKMGAAIEKIRAWAE